MSKDYLKMVEYMDRYWNGSKYVSEGIQETRLYKSVSRVMGQFNLPVNKDDLKNEECIYSLIRYIGREDTNLIVNKILV